MDKTEGENAGHLAARAAELVEKLRFHEIRAAVLKGSIRQYSIKVVLPQGQLVIHYSSKKNAFKYQLENVSDTELQQKIKECLEDSTKTLEAGKANGHFSAQEHQKDFTDMVSAFQEYLKSHEVDSFIKQAFYLPVPRVQMAVGSKDAGWGYLNIYQTKKGTCPKFHEIREAGKRELLQSLWNRFTQPADDDLFEVEYYLSVLKPYRNLGFDFLVLAQALARAWNRRMVDPLDADDLRYDFFRMEKCIDKLFSKIG